MRAGSPRHAGHVPALHHASRRAPRSRKAACASGVTVAGRSHRHHPPGPDNTLVEGEPAAHAAGAHPSRSRGRPGPRRARRHHADADARRAERLGHARVRRDARRAREGPHAPPRHRDGRALLALRRAHQPRSRVAGDAHLAPVRLRLLPGQEGGALRDARPRRGHLGAQRGRHRRRDVPAADLRHRPRARGDVLRRPRAARQRQPGVRVRRHRPDSAHVLARHRRRASGRPRARRRATAPRHPRAVRPQRCAGRARAGAARATATC